jgi:hypothetical protein
VVQFTTLHQKNNEKPLYNQLYILDTKDATEFRLNHDANKSCLKTVKIFNFLNIFKIFKFLLRLWKN